MAEQRVKSKNLFNFRPAGVVDADILEKEKAMMEEFGVDMSAMMEQWASMTDEEYATAVNGMMEGMSALFKGPVYSEVRKIKSVEHYVWMPYLGRGVV